MMTATRCCACGCKEPLDHRRSDALYATDACRTRAWKRRHRYTDQRRAYPSRNGKKRRAPDPRISLNRLLPALETELGSRRARQLVRELLPPRLKGRL